LMVDTDGHDTIRYFRCKMEEIQEASHPAGKRSFVQKACCGGPICLSSEPSLDAPVASGVAQDWTGSSRSVGNDRIGIGGYALLHRALTMTMCSTPSRWALEGSSLLMPRWPCFSYSMCSNNEWSFCVSAELKLSSCDVRPWYKSYN
jgi:hypothetical protein